MRVQDGLLQLCRTVRQLGPRAVVRQLGPRAVVQQSCSPARHVGSHSHTVGRVHTALVTGSTSGIGLGVARTLAQRGCSVILTGFGDETLIESLKAEFKSKYACGADHISADLTEARDIERLCQAITQLHPTGLDILVNNAGFQHVSPIEDFPEDKWNAMIGVMLSAPYHLIKRLLPNMRKKGWGRIVNLASTHGMIASPNKCAYVSAKHGVIGLTKVVALETAGSGVTCNAVCPGYVDTPILQQQVQTLAQTKGLAYDRAEAEFLSSFHPSGKSVGIEQVGEMVAFLCSDAASQMTGSSVVMDGGWTAR